VPEWLKGAVLKTARRREVSRGFESHPRRLSSAAGEASAEVAIGYRAGMSADENKALVRRFYEEIDKGNLAAMDELVAEDYINHHPPPFPGLAPGREGLKQAFKLFWEATPGYHQIEDQVADGDKVVTRLTVYGTHEQDLPGVPRTGNKLEMTATAIHRIANGQLVEHWSNTDELGLLQQLGVLPTPEAADA
jgi:steroid delta-isomerase-like uncharacterized protein